MRVVDARFDDSGSYQYIKFASREVFHNVFQLLFSHLAMGNANTCFTCGGLHALHRLIDGAYAIAYVVDLPATGHLSAYGVAHHVGIPLANMHFHRASVVGRSQDQTHVAHARKAHLHSTRDRGCGKREDIDRFAHVLQLLFMGNAKALFLINNDEAQIMRIDIA
ncbi:unknown [Eggerthella sp. CAG:209]|nr:unknown [Eggerthella sp. CAG:209]